jgi:hypothetical protein
MAWKYLKSFRLNFFLSLRHSLQAVCGVSVSCLMKCLCSTHPHSRSNPFTFMLISSHSIFKSAPHHTNPNCVHAFLQNSKFHSPPRDETTETFASTPVTQKPLQFSDTLLACFVENCRCYKTLYSSRQQCSLFHLGSRIDDPVNFCNTCLAYWRLYWWLHNIAK